ncbi:MAG: sigma-54-dependent Fis family transcriptional regulator [Rhizobiales bacterium]|nr:sigma-54-dependent Fis family transcriptional regulator [Hyphomicrobiales bacterium]
MAIDILVVDDEDDIRELVSGLLEDEGYEARTAATSHDAIAEIERRRPALVFLDIWLQGSEMDGLGVLDELKKHHEGLPVIMISGHGNIETAVSAIQRGAYDYIEKPFKMDRLLQVTARALEISRLRTEIHELRQRAGVDNKLVGQSFIFRQMMQTAQRIAPANSRIMISGPSGSGKELIAREIHNLSHRRESPFVILATGGIAPDQIEEELFGSESADGSPRRTGALERAHGGTLYLDEVADMPFETQNKILRVLIDQRFYRVNGATPVKIDVRFISSTARNLEAEIQQGTFRDDLFHRLAVVPLRVPALSERRDDIPFLVEHFMDQIAESQGLAKRPIADDAMAILQGHTWPGNIRQLRNNVERLMILATGEPGSAITVDLLPSEIGAYLPSAPNGSGGGEHLMAMPLREAREIFEREYLLAQIARFGGNVSRTADFVGMERSALHRKLKSLGVTGKNAQ